MSARLAVVGDVHRRFDEVDVAYFDAAGNDLTLFVGDIANYAHAQGIETARVIGKLKSPALFMPGNHDGVNPGQLLAEVVGSRRVANALGGGQQQRCREIRRELGAVEMVGYSLHDYSFGGVSFTIVAARPHSMGGPNVAFRKYLEAEFGVSKMEESSEKLRRLVDDSRHENLIFFAHNGPTGLGARRDDIWGCDFRKTEGDFGDLDLEQAVAHARSSGKSVLAVIAGHMHHALKGGGTRTWQREESGTLYLNAARVPRRFRDAGGVVHRHHVLVTLEAEGAQAEEMLIAGG